MKNKESGDGLGEAAEQAFGRRVREMRTEAGMTQADLADMMTKLGASMSQTMVAKLERGARPTSIGELTILAGIFEVSPAELVEDSALPDRVAKLKELRIKAHNYAGSMERLVRSSDDLGRAIEERRAALSDTVSQFDMAAAAATAEHGPGWLSKYGMDETLLNPYFEKLINRGQHPEA